MAAGASGERFCPKCGARGTSAYCPDDGTEMKLVLVQTATRAAGPTTSPGWNAPEGGAAAWREVPARAPKAKPWGLWVGAAVVVVIVVLIGAAIALNSLSPSQPTSGNPPSTPTLPYCTSTTNCIYPSSVVLLSNAVNMCNGAGGTSNCPSMSGGGFGCDIPNDYTLGCHLTYNYTSFHITWSATGPLGVGVGSSGTNCRWFDAGGCSGTAASSGDHWVTANWGADSAIWFNFENMGSTTITVSSLSITAYYG